MARKGLTREKIITTARKFIEEKGYKHFSLRALAAKLNIKAASLYNHIQNAEEISIEIGVEAIEELVAVQEAALEGKPRQEAIWSLATAYLDFALQKPEVYKIIMLLPAMDSDIITRLRPKIVEPAIRAVSLYQLNEEQKMHWQRVLRGTMHGFASEEDAGYFSHFAVDVNESYRLAIMNIIAALETLERENLSRLALLQMHIKK